MELIPILITATISIILAILGYIFGRKSKIDEIQIAKRHELAEQLSVLLQEDFDDRLSIRKGYHLNFDHLNDFSKAMYYFDKDEHDYLSIREYVNRIPSRITALKEINQKAAIYLPEKVTSLVSQYINLTIFAFTIDGIGVTRDYNEKFFENLLNENTWDSLSKCFNLLLNRLRKSVK